MLPKYQKAPLIEVKACLGRCYIDIKTVQTSKRDGAGDGVRTRDPKLGKLVLYQLSYTRPKISL